ncbi:hypothetical protein PUN28_005953 [Cardiocondyla obscurior]|uniref:Uncharacterized protein n=2 Tax=Cardiocondyla obscurior TaxID=286306 RepID=A0AAW2G6C3_9HYME
MKFVIFTIFAIIAMAAAAFQGMQNAQAAKPKCMPLSLPCRQRDDCCRHLKCQEHANICVKETNPSEDDPRDVGPKMPY